MTNDENEEGSDGEARQDPARFEQALGHAAAPMQAFRFDTTDEFEAAMATITRDIADELAGATFHVRVHRRGGPKDFVAADEEALIADTLLAALDETGSTAVVAFDDPDAVIDVQTVDGWAGVGVRTREDRRAFPFVVS